MELLKKSVSTAAVKDVDAKGRTVTGYYASWGKDANASQSDKNFVDSDGDVFDPHAFDTTIKQNGPTGANRIWHLFNHNFGAAINKPKLLQPDNFGVYFETVFPDTTLGNDTLKLYQAGAITEHSVMFEMYANEAKAENGQTFNLITEARMWEGSSVLWGANSNTPTTGIKSEQAEAQIKLLDALMHNGTFSDETFLMIEKLLADIKAIYKTASVPEVLEIPQPEPATLNMDAILLQFTKTVNSKF